MYCDRDKENNHIAGEERAPYFIALYYTYYRASGKSASLVYSLRRWSFALQPPRPLRSVRCHRKVSVNINALPRHEIQFWYPSRYLHAFVHSFADSRLSIGRIRYPRLCSPFNFCAVVFLPYTPLFSYLSLRLSSSPDFYINASLLYIFHIFKDPYLLTLFP